jgi:hypothetical protein
MPPGPREGRRAFETKLAPFARRAYPPPMATRAVGAPLTTAAYATFALASACLGGLGCDAQPPSGGRPAPALARVSAAGATLGGLPPSSPGSVPCADGVSCPVTKAGRTVCCHAPNSPPMCRDGAKCGQISGHRYEAMLACDEPADCAGVEPGKDVVCCLSDDGAKAKGASASPFNRAACVPRAACASPSTAACRSDAECQAGRQCRATSMGAGLTVGACL